MSEQAQAHESLFNDDDVAAVLDELGDDQEVETRSDESVDDEVLQSLEDEDSADQDLKKSISSKSSSDEPLKTEDAEEKPIETAKPARAKSSRTKTSGLLPSEAAVKLLGDSVKANGLKVGHGKVADIYKLDTLAKKVREKVVNLIECQVEGRAPSVYTTIALKLLEEKGAFTVSDLRNKYIERPYSPGTASAQASQMMIMLPAMGIAQREGKTLHLDPDSTIYSDVIDVISE